MRARSFIERAEALGEPPEDPLLLFSVLYGFWVTNQTAFNGDVICTLASQFLARAERQEATFPRVIEHRLMGVSLLQTGDIEQARSHLDRAIALYNPAEHRALALRFGIDVRVAAFYFRSWTMWMLGYPEAALDDVERAVKDAREIGQAGTLMYALIWTSMIQIYCGKYAAADAQAQEHTALANEKGSSYWTAAGMCTEGLLLYQRGRASDAVQILNLAIDSWRSTGATLFTPTQLMWLAAGFAELGQLNDAYRIIGEAMTVIEASKETWFEAEVNRMTGEIALKSPEQEAAKAASYFERALVVARQQQAKSWELRAAMSMARLWRDQGKRDEARELLAPVYGWFTEGFDTRDLKEAKGLLDELGA
jgi:predicted ATPase